MTTLAAITAALVAALSAQLGDYDLTGTDQVKVGTYTAPPGSLAFIAVPSPAVVSKPFDLRQRKWQHTCTFRLRLWVPWTGEDPAIRAAAAVEIANRAARAIEDARRSDPDLLLCGSLIVGRAEFDAASARTPPGWAAAFLTVSTVHFTERGI